MTPFQYAKAELASERMPELPIDGVAGSFWLCSRDWSPLRGKHYASRDAAATDRSKILARAGKAHWHQ
jgi:hypothetical protein